MNSVINLARYRKEKRQLWLARNQKRLFDFLHNYLRQKADGNFLDAYQAYQDQRFAYNETSWDYTTLREAIYDAMFGRFGEELYCELRTQWWFDGGFCSKEETLDFCVSIFIMDSLQPAQARKSS